MSNILRQSVMVLGGTGFVGWICWKGMEGTDEDVYRQYKEDKGKTKSYDERAMMIEVLTAGGDSNLSKVRQRTDDARRKIAEEHTTYNIPISKTSEDSEK